MSCSTLLEQFFIVIRTLLISESTLPLKRGRVRSYDSNRNMQPFCLFQHCESYLIPFQDKYVPCPECPLNVFQFCCCPIESDPVNQIRRPPQSHFTFVIRQSRYPPLYLNHQHHLHRVNIGLRHLGNVKPVQPQKNKKLARIQERWGRSNPPVIQSARIPILRSPVRPGTWSQATTYWCPPTSDNAS